MSTLPLLLLVLAAAEWYWPVAAFFSRPLPGVRSAQAVYIGNISDVAAPMPRLASTNSTSGAVGAGRLEGAEQVEEVGGLATVTECGRTFRIDEGQTALLFSRQDLYRYECVQTFEVINMDGRLVLTCHHLHFKFNCFLESLTVTVDGQDTTYCMRDEAGIHTGKEVRLTYKRVLGGIHGGYVCTLVAKPPITPNLLSHPCTKCGISSVMEVQKERTGVLRVVGGTTTKKDEYPWTAFLVIHLSNSKYRCGGSLITDTLILSAAHCFAGYDIKYIEVGLGKLDVSVKDEVGADWVTTTQYEIHPLYDDYTFENDMSLVILPKPVTFSQAIRPICLPTDDMPMEGYTVTAAGWGTLSYSGDLANELQEVEMMVWSNADCQSAWRKKFSDNNFHIVASQVCAGAAGKDTCNGDSGGPLMVKVRERWQLLGVTSYGYKCAEPGLAGVYTRISKFLTWLDKFIPESYCEGGEN